jgi:hypothetical protein
MKTVAVVMWGAALGTGLCGAVILMGFLRLLGVDLTTIDFVRDVLPWFMSAITLYMTFLQGRKRWTAWVVGLVNQLLWLWFMLDTRTWGLIPLNVGLWWLYARNLRMWYDEEKALRYQQQAYDGVLPSQRRFYSTTDELRRPRVKQP